MPDKKKAIGGICPKCGKRHRLSEACAKVVVKLHHVIDRKQHCITLKSGRKVYVLANALMRHGRTFHPGDAMSSLTKGERRRVRRHLDRIGRRDLSVRTFAKATVGFQWRERDDDSSTSTQPTAATSNRSANPVVRDKVVRGRKTSSAKR